MSKIIVITSGKGGVGKTTSTANLGMALTRFEKKVLLMDCDLELRNLDLLLGLEKNILCTGSDVIAKRCSLEKALLTHKTEHRLTFLPIAANKDIFQIAQEDLIKFTSALKNEYDFILIDSPTGLEKGFKVAIEAAQEALVVVTPDIASLRDAEKTIQLLEKKGVIINLLINRVKPITRKGKPLITKEEIQNTLPFPILGIIPEHNDIDISSYKGEPIVVGEPLSKPAKAYIRTAQRLLGQNIPLEEKREKFLTRFFGLEN